MGIPICVPETECRVKIFFNVMICMGKINRWLRLGAFLCECLPGPNDGAGRTVGRHCLVGANSFGAAGSVVGSFRANGPAPNRVSLVGTRREYVHVGSYRPSMASTVPTSDTRFDAYVLFSEFGEKNGLLSYWLQQPHAVLVPSQVWFTRTVERMDARYEPTWMYLRRVLVNHTWFGA
jgi:hypothetical protein